MNQEQASQVKDLAKPCNDILERLGWKWEPKVGEWCYWKGGAYPSQLQLIVKVTEIDEEKYLRFVDETKWHEAEGFIPILHWEEIERVLEGVGYFFRELTGKMAPGYYRCTLMGENGIRVEGEGEFRQEAVMRAVIKLGERLSENK